MVQSAREIRLRVIKIEFDVFVSVNLFLNIILKTVIRKTSPKKIYPLLVDSML